MKHKVGKQGLVVPFGYVTVEGRPYPYQQGQAIPADSVITKVEGDNENDAARTTAKLKEALGIKDSPVGP